MFMYTGLPHTQGTREFSSWIKFQGNSGNFDLFYELRET